MHLAGYPPHHVFLFPPSSLLSSALSPSHHSLSLPCSPLSFHSISSTYPRAYSLLSHPPSSPFEAGGGKAPESDKYGRRKRRRRKEEGRENKRRKKEKRKEEKTKGERRKRERRKKDKGRRQTAENKRGNLNLTSGSFPSSLHVSDLTYEIKNTHKYRKKTLFLRLKGNRK